MPAKAHVTRNLHLKPADPFELIRWLARSQSDPRKGAAELVQNSLDAGARTISIARRRRHKVVELSIMDDGEGVLPDLSREDALAYLATHVGRSRKLGLDPAERAQRVIAGKYGVGLLGFWCIGKVLELRSRVAGSKLHVLRLNEDSPKAEILVVPLRTDAHDTYTEVVVSGLHDTAVKALGGRRLADYLAGELRGQLLRGTTTIEIHDGIARGTAQQDFVVAPRRFSGERLALPEQVDVPGHAPLRVELYLARGAERPAIQVAAAGSLVADDLCELSALDLAETPWIGRELTGILDYASFNVPPGTRRGIVPDAAAEAFVAAMAGLKILVEAQLEKLATERRALEDRDVAKELRRALKGLGRRLPHVQLPPVDDRRPGAVGEGKAPGDDGASRTGPAEGDGAATADAADPDPDEPAEPALLFPPGPLESVRIVPEIVEVAPGGERRVRAVPADRSGRRPDGVTFEWRLDSHADVLLLRGEGSRPAIVALADALPGLASVVRVVARQGAVEAARQGAVEAVRQGAVEASAEATVTVREATDEDSAAALGIPRPHFVSDAQGSWRSRMAGGRWEVNDAHDDFVALRSNARSRLRYLVALLAREIVVRSTSPESAAPLDAMIDVVAHAERNLSAT